MQSNPYQDQIDQLTALIAENEALLADPELAELAQTEIVELTAQKTMLEEAAAALQSNSADAAADSALPKNCIIEVRGGAGGDEAKLWADEILRMYTRFAEKAGLKIEFIDDGIIKLKGQTQILNEWQTANPAPDTDSEIESNLDHSPLNLTVPFAIFQYESGVHRVQRVPATESQGRIHTSTASVAVLPEVHPSAIEIKNEDLEWQFMRSSGAGGQSVNKTSSAVRLIHKPTGLVTTARQEKKQEQNRKIALEHLRAKMWDIQEEERLKQVGEARSAIGRAQRAEKIRTYNFPQNRITDHRIKQSWHNLPGILEGAMESLLVVTARLMTSAE